MSPTVPSALIFALIFAKIALKIFFEGLVFI